MNGGIYPVWETVYAQAQEVVPEGAEESAAPNPFGNMLPFFILLFAIMYFLMIRPQQKKDKERREMLAALAKGDEVVTSGGLCGTVVGLSEKTVVLRVTDDEPGVKMEFLRGAITQITSRQNQK